MGKLLSKLKRNTTNDYENSHDPRIFGSATSLNFTKPSHNPAGNRHYDQPDHTQNHNHGNGQNRPFAARKPRKSPPTVHMDPQENRDKFPSRPNEGTADETVPSLPPRSSRPAEIGRPSAPESDDGYLKARNGKAKLETENVYDSPELNLKQKVIAEKNYQANYDCDISFNKGDILLLIKEREIDDWYIVRNLRTDEEGYAPKAWVTLITSNDVESQKCFFKNFDREEAIERLSQPEVQTGTYLLRPSGGLTGDSCALSLRCENELYETEIRHYRIRIADKGICYIEADFTTKPFGSITELIKFYTDKPGLRCKLKSPLPQDVTLNELIVKFSDLKLGEVLGSGNFGFVYAGTLNKNKQVAVKSLKEQGSMTVEEFRKEAETMHKLHHQNLVSLLGICEHSGKILIITERMSNGALLNLLRDDCGYAVKFKDLMHMAIQVVDGMCYLEKKGFVHRDLRAANVLVGDGYITKITDFGLARLLNSYYEHEDFFQDKKGCVLPYKWTAPEAIKQLKFTVKSDVWSFGILLYEIVTYGDEPYAAMSNAEVLEWLEKGNRLKRPTGSHCPATLYNIMKQCWAIHSDDRPDFADINETLVEIKMNA